MTRLNKLICVLFVVIICAVMAQAAPPELISESAVLIDADSGQILYDKDMHQQMYPASITKILTAIIGIENIPLEEKLIMSRYAVFSVPRGSSHIALDEGEEITMEQALHAALLSSANDACNGIAEAAAGSIDDFVIMMNETAQKAGAINSNFVNAHGFHDENHYTTAYDMAMICKYALRNETFKNVFGEYRYIMPPNNKQEEERIFINQHLMISDPQLQYEGIIGGKTGWTSNSQCTLVTAAERDGRTLIAVVMKCVMDDDKYADTKALLDYGFSEFSEVTLTERDLPQNLNCELEEDIKLLLPLENAGIEFDFAIDNSGESSVLVISDKEKNELLRVPCIISEPTNASEPDAAGEENEGISFLGVIGWILLGLLALVVVAIIGLWTYKQIYRARRRYLRKRRRR